MNETIQMRRTIMEETEAREGYKKTKLGWIPEEWGIARFNKIAVFNPKSESLPDSFIYIDLESVKDGVLRNKNMINKTNAPSRAQRLLEKNDVLFQTVRPYQKNNLYFEEEKENYVASSGYAQIRSKRDSQFIFHLIQSTYFNNQVLARCTGTSFPAISSKDLSKVLIKLPTLPERQKIATILSTWDRAIAKQQQLIAAKQEYKKGLMQLLLTGKLRFEGFEGEWEEMKLGKYCTMYSGGTPSRAVKEYYGGNIPWIKSGELNQGLIVDVEESITELALKNSSAKMVESGTLLLALYGATAGVVAITDVKGAINQAILAIEPTEEINKFFLYYLLKAKMPRYLENLVQGGQPNLNGGMIKKIKLEMPVLKEQEKITSVLTVADSEIALLENELVRMREQKRGLMQRLLTGEVRVKI